MRTRLLTGTASAVGLRALPVGIVGVAHGEGIPAIEHRFPKREERFMRVHPAPR